MFKSSVCFINLALIKVYWRGCVKTPARYKIHHKTKQSQISFACQRKTQLLLSFAYSQIPSKNVILAPSKNVEVFFLSSFAGIVLLFREISSPDSLPVDSHVEIIEHRKDTVKPTYYRSISCQKAQFQEYWSNHLEVNKTRMFSYDSP